MRIRNGGPRFIYWRTFKPDDTWHWGGLDDGYLEPTKSGDTSPGYDKVQIQITEPPHANMGWTAKDTVSADASTTFGKDSEVYYTGNALVELASDFFNFTGMTLPSGTPPTGSPINVDANKVLNALVSLASALVSNAWPDAPTKWTQAGVFNVATSLVSLFTPQAGSSQDLPSNIDVISSALQTVINQAAAQTAAAQVMATTAWLKYYLDLSRAKGGNAIPTADLAPADRAAFLTGLTDVLGPNSLFLNQITILQTTSTIRSYAIPSYLTGMMLHLNLVRLNMAINGWLQDPPHVNELLGIAGDYWNSLNSCEVDYYWLLSAQLQTWPITVHGALVNVDRTDVVSVPVPGGVPLSDEATALARAVIQKYLQGNRMVIEITRAKLQSFINAIRPYAGGP